MRTFTALHIIAGLLIAGLAHTSFAQEDEAIATLTSNASRKDKIEACRVLSRHGTEKSIPTLAPLLLDDELAHMARYALEPMPYPAAGQTLRDALETTSGLLQVGVISSIAVRDDEQAVPLLAALLTKADAQVANAAAKALGDIATPDAAGALRESLDANRSAAGNPVVYDALLGCAGTFAADGQRDQAAEIYQSLLNVSDAPEHIPAAAFRGAVLTSSGAERATYLTDALSGDDEAKFDMALRVGRELGDDEAVTTAFAHALSTLPDARTIRVLAVFEPGDGPAAGDAALAQLGGASPEVRVAAIQAVTRMGHEPALEAIEALAVSDDAALAEAARASLSYFPDNRGDAAIRNMLASDDPNTRLTAVALVGEGALQEPVDVLMESALNDADPKVQMAALEALPDYAGVDQLQSLLDHFLATPSAEHREATRAVLATISDREKKMPGGIVVTKAVYGSVSGEPNADVTDKVKSLVESGMVAIDASNNTFGDTAPGHVKQLRIDYTDNSVPASKTVREGEMLSLGAATAPPAVVDAFSDAFAKAEGDAKLAMIRLLGSTGSPKAFDVVHTAYGSSDPDVRAESLRTMCEWPTPVALPTLKEIVNTAGDASQKLAALRGTVRLLAVSRASAEDQVAEYTTLVAQAAGADEKMVVLSGLAQMTDAAALDLAFAQFDDAAVRDEAVQTAINIARNIGKTAQQDAAFFNGNDLSGWNGTMTYWSVEDGAIVGHSDTEIPKNEFLWSPVEAGNFYLVLDVLLEPNNGNAGIQIRSEKINEAGQAKGYQADVGEGYWGRLYHEHGRAMLDDSDAAEKAVKLGEWNRYEILAIGPAIWTAINGTVGTAFLDLDPSAERTGKIALQVHSGPPLTVRYRIHNLVHNPPVALEGKKVEDLIPMLRTAK